MNLTTRIEKLEAKMEEISPSKERLDYVIMFRKDEQGIEQFHIRREGEWSWVIKEELDIFLEQFRDGNGVIIFLPEELKR